MYPPSPLPSCEPSDHNLLSFFFSYSYLSAPLECILYERGVLFVLFTALCLVPKNVCGASQLLIRLCFPLGLRFDFTPLTSS